MRAVTRLLGRRLAARTIGGAALVIATAPTSATATTPPPARSLCATAHPRELPFGRSTVISGTLTAATSPATPIPAEPLELQASRYPFARYHDVGHVQTAADGSFSFHHLRPGRNTRYRVVDLGMPTVFSAPVTVLVDAPAVQHVYRRRDGAAIVTVRSYHGRDLNWSGRPVYWFAAPFGSRSFTLIAVTRTRDLRPGVTYMAATFYAPARHFVYRVCFDPPLEQAFGRPHPPCPTSSFVLPRRHGNAG
jgi:hypothetical protein